MDVTGLKYGTTRNGVYMEASADLDPGESAVEGYHKLQELVERELVRYAIKSPSSEPSWYQVLRECATAIALALHPEHRKQIQADRLKDN